MVQNQTSVLIAGAGPTGLAAALFLAERGVTARIVDAAPQPSPWSRALAVNPRTLELLEPTGVTARIVTEGLAIHRMRIHQDGHLLAEARIDPSRVGARFDMTALSQARTEALLTEALAAKGIAPERGLALKALSQDDDGVAFTLVDAEGREQTGRAAILLGADGAHSAARHALGLGFPGSKFDEPWQIVDVRLSQPDPEPYGHLDFQKSGLFLALPFDRANWRLIGFGAEVTTRLPAGWRLDEVVWRSEFRISHRLAERLNVGRVCLAGDAAHIHSPMGARGMNLGIEDAFVFANLAVEALEGRWTRLDDYGRLRHEADGAVVKRIETFTRAVRANGPVARALRPLLAPLMVRIPAALDLFTRTGTGFDHPVRLE